MTGFGAVPDELRQAAGAIGNVIGGVAELVWRGPGGDYGHPGVQQGWAQFIEDMRGQVDTLKGAAEEHGEKLKSAATRYLESDSDVGKVVGGLGDLIDGAGDGGMIGGGWAGPLNQGTGIGGSPADGGGPAGIMSPERSRELFGEGNGGIADRLNPDDGTDERVF